MSQMSVHIIINIFYIIQNMHASYIESIAAEIAFMNIIESNF